MLDNSTRRPITVSIDGYNRPYIMVPVDQVDDVRKILDRHRVVYSVDREAISLDGEPAVTVVNIGSGTDAETLQHYLDEAP